ncbi:nucleoside recognition domain-containing protein [Limibacter armeniacum]|uniref:nucleoside recognition domain-containing protein n=1 Tax=Limibacter armeniacum TaxID=466084 RepID=UPI002FE574AA
MVLNYIWTAFILIAFLVALVKTIFWGDQQVFTAIVDSTFDMSETAFKISIGLTGTITLWMGLMKIGEEAGIVKVMSKVVGPFFKRIFPDLGENHPAMTPILMNFSANMLGLDNAATPLGLKAMKEMQATNPNKDTASNSMIMFLVLNTSGLTLIPITVLMYRAQMGAAQPADVFIPIMLATLASTLAGLMIIAVYQRINLFDKVIMLYLGLIVAFIAGVIYLFSNMDSEQVKTVSSMVSNIILFSVIVFFVGLALYRRINAYDAFIDGAKDGFSTAVQIIPYLVAMLISIGIFRASGALDIVMDGLHTAFNWAGWNGEFIEALPVALMKPLSGSGARGLMIDAMNTYGADSFIGRLVSTMQGATDTTLYIIAVYFGAVNVKHTRYAITCGLFADAVGVIAAILIAYMFFG